MKITLRYRPTAKPIILHSQEQTIEGIAEDCARQLRKRYQYYLKKNGIIKSEQHLRRYEIGNRFMLIEKLEEKISELKKH